MRLATWSAALAVMASMALPTPVLAHGGSEMEMKELSQEPARTLAQQAIAELKIRGDTKTAAAQLDAAVESKDKSDIDVNKLRTGMEMLDSGHRQAAISTLDEALSLPLGAKRGKVKHEAGREFQPATGAQDRRNRRGGRAAAARARRGGGRPAARAPSGGTLSGASRGA